MYKIKFPKLDFMRLHMTSTQFAPQEAVNIHQWHNTHPTSRVLCTVIWVRSRNSGCLVTWFCYQLIAKPGNKTAAFSWPDPYSIDVVSNLSYSESQEVCMWFMLWSTLLWLGADFTHILQGSFIGTPYCTLTWNKGNTVFRTSGPKTNEKQNSQSTESTFWQQCKQSHDFSFLHLVTLFAVKHSFWCFLWRPIWSRGSLLWNGFHASRSSLSYHKRLINGTLSVTAMALTYWFDMNGCLIWNGADMIPHLKYYSFKIWQTNYRCQFHCNNPLICNRPQTMGFTSAKILK